MTVSSSSVTPKEPSPYPLPAYRERERAAKEGAAQSHLSDLISRLRALRENESAFAAAQSELHVYLHGRHRRTIERRATDRAQARRTATGSRADREGRRDQGQSHSQRRGSRPRARAQARVDAGQHGPAE